MNRYPVWKYILIAVTILLGALYSAPNYFGEAPAVQVTSGKSTLKLTSDMVAKVDDVLTREKIDHSELTSMAPAPTPRCACAFPIPTPSSAPRPCWKKA